MDPSDPPPPYTSRPSYDNNNRNQTEDNLPRSSPSLSPSARRSMEDEFRPLPEHWIRQYDVRSGHQFFVDTSQIPPRSIWHHPYDDTIYISSLPQPERLKIENLGKRSHISLGTSTISPSSVQTQRDEYHESFSGIQNFGRRLKDAILNSTHDERIKARKDRERMEIELYRQHQHIRAKMSEAIQTGKPQLIGKDSEGKDVWIDTPKTYNSNMGGNYSSLLGASLTMSGREFCGRNKHVFNPYGSGLSYGSDSRYARPQAPYQRPIGIRYGGGMGLPLGVGIAGGMIGGLMF
ncbi:putative ww rsp5 wwp protein [Golovinomyces cichoracearum]|uniref:Putative ww rsp5 wwp protein n=1 Tax=Golovinomyces cichoracearum TaxID=62708 RepID=A0A420IDP0_9PEZI|nr:putative ww rsp5 wwp protein [Golovinomyces cichoracearum]